MTLRTAKGGHGAGGAAVHGGGVTADPTSALRLGGEDSLEKGMATHSSILAQRSPWTEKPDGL